MRLGSLGVVLAGAALALAAPAASAADFPPPIDKQVVQDQDDMTWNDYRPVPGTNWADPSLRADGPQAEDRRRRGRLLRPAVRDHPAEGVRPVRQPADRPGPARGVAKFYADFIGNPSALNNGHTVNEYWMEQTGGRIGMTFTPYGPYRMPRPLYEYGLNEFGQPGADRHGCPAATTVTGAQTAT